jgi:hypothetical protein
MRSTASATEALTTEEPIIAIKSRATHPNGGVTNRVRSVLMLLSTSVGTQADVTVKLYSNPTSYTGSSFADVNATNSVMQVDSV